MEELLKNILSLREDINKLSEISDNKSFEYRQLSEEYTNTKEDILTMSSEKNCIENYIKDFKYNKSLLYSLPVGIIISSLFLGCSAITSVGPWTFGGVIATFSVSSACGLAISLIVASLLVPSKIFSNFLIKKYPIYKYRDDILNSLNLKIKEAQINLDNIEKKIDEIMNIMKTSKNIIESKREELSKLEEEYLANIVNNPNNEETTYSLSSAGKKRVLSRKND